jgi:cyclopropane-fatty-acyl-phospholipid synthase
MRRLLEMGGSPPIRVVLWNGAEVLGSDAPPVATVTIRHAATFARMLVRPEIAFGEGYASGAIDIEGDLVGFLEAFNAPEVRLGSLQRTAARLFNRPRSNGRRGSRENIHAHYDLGNDFYKLWLDERLVYTCAYYRTHDDSLEEAQRAKLEHVCRKLDLKPGERVLEVGCGWGALALYMAERYGVSVRAFNVSKEQVAHAREQARERSLEGRVEFVEGDYREATGAYDAFVSIGMLEHVGREHYDALGALVDRTLARDGRGLLHFIGRPRPCPLNPWVEAHIFPGAHIPSLREGLEVLEPRDFSVLDVENLRFHYARTLEQWLERFERVAPDVERQFGAAFVRTWRLYLACSTSGFRGGSLELFQVLFARPARKNLRLTRAHLYDQGAASLPSSRSPRDATELAALEEPVRWNAAAS